MVTHSSILAWRIPMDREAWQVQSTGVAKSRTRLKRRSRHACAGTTPTALHFYNFISLFLAPLGLHCFTQAFSRGREWTLCFAVVHRLLLVVASLVAERALGTWASVAAPHHRALERGHNCWGSRA